MFNRLDATREISVLVFVLWETSTCWFIGTLRLRELR
jgi:hypothetical protein